MTAFRSLATWRGDGPLGAWLSRIAVRLAVRRAGRRRPVAWLGSGLDATDGPTRERDRATGADPASLVVQAERQAALQRAVGRLDDPYREVVILRFFAELSLAEIAATVDRPIGTVKTHLHRGLIRLRSSLDAAGVDR